MTRNQLYIPISDRNSSAGSNNDCKVVIAHFEGAKDSECSSIAHAAQTTIKPHKLKEKNTASYSIATTVTTNKT